MLGIELTPEHPVEDVVEFGTTAETAGYDTVFATCHYNNRDPFAVLTRLATETEAVRLGPGVANPYEMHPATLAGKVATLDETSDGRAVFGIGPGDPSTLRNLGLADERGLRSVLDAMELARDLWDGKRVSTEGTITTEEAGLNFEPPSEIPVYVGGEGPHMCRMAGKRADGLLFNGSHPADVAWARDRVEEGLAERGGTTDSALAEGAETDGSAKSGERGADAFGFGADAFDFAAYASVSVADDSERAREAARPPVAFIVAGAAPPVLDRHDIEEELAERIGQHISAGEFSAAFDLVTPAMIDAFCVAGTVTDVAERMAAVLAHADSFVVGAPLGPDPAEAISLAAEAHDRAVRLRD